MVSFADHPQACNRMMERGYGMKIPCAFTKPCPIHGRKAHPPLPSQGVEAPQTSAPCPLPAPRLFDNAKEVA
jgi:hypothetical protein